jgi:hypothetical protein
VLRHPRGAPHAALRPACRAPQAGARLPALCAPRHRETDAHAELPRFQAPPLRSACLPATAKAKVLRDGSCSRPRRTQRALSLSWLPPPPPRGAARCAFSKKKKQLFCSGATIELGIKRGMHQLGAPCINCAGREDTHSATVAPLDPRR